MAAIEQYRNAISVDEKLAALEKCNIHGDLSLNQTIDNKNIVTSFPPNLAPPIKFNSEKDILDLLYSSYYHMTMRTCRGIGYCFLSGNTYDEDDGNLIYSRLDCLKYVNNHHMYGTYTYHKDFRDRIKYLDLIKQYEGSIICKHNLQGKTVKILRSSGKIQQHVIDENNPIQISSSGNLLINIYVDPKIFLTKEVGFLDIPSRSSDRIHKGLISQNPEIFNEDFVLEIGCKKLDVDWFNESEKKWKSKFSDLCEKTGIKYKFYDY